MRFSLKTSVVAVSTALVLSSFGAIQIAAADNSGQSNNIRENQYDENDTQHLNPLSKIVAMPIRNAATGKAIIAGEISYTLNTPVLINPSIYVIWYGTWTSPCTATGTATPAIVNDLLKGIGGTNWYGINTRYYKQSTSGGVKTYVTPNVTWGGCTYDNMSLGNKLDSTTGNFTYNVVDNALTNSALTRDPNGLYFVFTSSDVTVRGFKSSFCGYHSALSPTYAASPKPLIAYSFVGDATGTSLGSCNGQGSTTSPNANPAADAMTSVVAHELVEAVSDPQINTWVDAGGNENADKCAWTFGTQSLAPNGSYYNVIASSRKYLIQQNWIPDVPGSCGTGITPPASAVTNTANLSFVKNVPATSVIPVVGAGGRGPYTYTISPTLPAGLFFNLGTGQITGTPTAELAPTVETVTVKDSTNAVWDSSFLLTVTVPLAATTAVPTASLSFNAPITPVTPVTASGGTAPYRFTISPTLPAGLALSSTTGQITGTPTAVLASRVETITVTDSKNATATATFNLAIPTAATFTPTVASASAVKKAMVTKALTAFTPVTATGGNGANVFTISPTLPAGLSINATTGAITGTPTATLLVATNETVRITDRTGAFVTGVFSLQVSPAITATVAIANSTYARNVTLTFTPITGGGSIFTPLAYSVSPALPSTMSLNTTTGLITGKAPTGTASRKTYTVTVSDAAAFSTSATFNLTIN